MNILNNPHHVLHKFLPDKTDHAYNLRSGRHSLSLSVKTDDNDDDDDDDNNNNNNNTTTISKAP